MKLGDILATTPEIPCETVTFCMNAPASPNSVGAPPTIPQALNRYAATAVGQPGVVQAAASVGGLSGYPLDRSATVVAETSITAIAARDAIVQAALGYAAGKAIEGTASGSLTIVTSRSTWYRTVGEASRGLRGLFRKPSIAQPQFGKTFRAFTTLGRVRQLNGGQYLAETGEIIETAGLPSSALVKFTPRLSPLARNLAGASFAFIVSAIFQRVEDSGDLYLMPYQRNLRIGISGLGGLLSWGAGLGTTGLLTAAGVGSLAGPIGIVVGVGVTFFWITVVQPVIFENAGLESQRSMAPLQS